MAEGTINVSSDSREATLTGLTPSAQYTVSVAAVNSVGSGPITSLTIKTVAGETFLTCPPHALLLLHSNPSLAFPLGIDIVR